MVSAPSDAHSAGSETAGVMKHVIKMQTVNTMQVIVPSVTMDAGEPGEEMANAIYGVTTQPVNGTMAIVL